MVRILLDTCVLSEMQRYGGDPRVQAAVRAYSSNDVYFSVITIGEISKGLSLLPLGQRREVLEAWLQKTEIEYRDRILAIDIDVARVWGEIAAQNSRAGTPVDAADGLIAATAHYYQLPVMTRNVRHFLQAGLEIINPWSGLTRAVCMKGVPRSPGPWTKHVGELIRPTHRARDFRCPPIACRCNAMSKRW